MATSLAVASPVLVLCILLGAAAHFLSLAPRLRRLSGRVCSRRRNHHRVQRHVELGRIGEIQQSSSVVMHIQIDGDEQGSFDLKWRGVALSNFDGRTWSNNREQHVLSPAAGRAFRIAAGARRCPEELFPSDSLSGADGAGGNEVFFLAAAPESLEGNYRHVAWTTAARSSISIRSIP